MDTVFKVVSRWKVEDQYELRSAFHCAIHKPPFSLRYIPGEIIEPAWENSYLYAFDWLDAATEYCRNTAYGDVRLEMWQCAAIVVAGPDVVGTLSCKDEQLRKFWDEQLYAVKYPVADIFTMKHSVWCSQLRMQKQLRW